MAKIKAADIRVLLRQRFNGPEWVYAEEVADGTGANKNRSIDAVAMGVWQKAEYRLNCFEIKVDRSDWQKELNDVSKAAPFEKVSHYFWLVAPKEIVKLEEIPVNWGWLWPGATRLNIGKRPVRNMAAQVTFEFFAAILRKVSNANNAEQAQLEAMYARGYKDGIRREEKRGVHVMAQQMKAKDFELEQLKRGLRDFQEMSGIDIQEFRYNGKKLGEVVKTLMHLPRPDFYQSQVDSVINHVNHLRISLEQLREQVPCIVRGWPDGENELPK